MERKNFLRGIGLISISSVFPEKKNILNTLNSAPLGTCILTPTDEEGPFPYPGGEINSPLFRSDLRETQTGAVMTLTLTLTNLDCTPLSGIRVDIWSCNKDGFYSGYSQPGGDYTGQTFLRGYQLTDSNGQLTFTTIYPGWYNGRINHFHLEIFVGTTLKKTTQLCFPDSWNTTVNSFYGRPITGGSPATNAADHVFSDTENTALEMVTISGDATNGFSASRNLTIDFAVLPISLVSFEAGISGKNNLLWWKTANEMNCDRFEVERSTDTFIYSAIKTVLAINAANGSNYSIRDENPLAGKTFYRLKVVDRDGKFTYSEIAGVNRKVSQRLSISPNPAGDNITLIHPKSGTSATIKILSAEGRSVANGKVQPNVTATLINVKMLASGTYFLLFDNDGVKEVSMFIKK